MTTLTRRRLLLAALALCGVTACTIEMPDLNLEAAMTPIPGPSFRAEVRVAAGKSVVFHSVMVDDEPVHAVAHGVRFDAVIVPPSVTGKPRRLLGTVVLVDGGPHTKRAPSETKFPIDEVLDVAPVVWRQHLKDWTMVSDGPDFRVSLKD